MKKEPNESVTDYVIRTEETLMAKKEMQKNH